MSPSGFRRIAAVAGTDFLFRFRTMSAVVVLLIVAGGVYLIVPDVSSGRALMQINGHRTVLNSASVALGTAIFCSILLSLAGYYLVSNSFRRDITSRTAFILAASPVTNAEYLLGKLTGNLAYLLTVAFVSMLSAMIMFLLRGETSLEPMVFLVTYFWIVLPVIVFCSASALAFEALPLLSGRFGDVVYFFLWAAMLGMPGALYSEHPGSQWLKSIDLSGLITIMAEMKEQFHTEAMNIGNSAFKPGAAPMLFNGIQISWQLFWERASTLIFPLMLVAGAITWFHRYDPVRTKSSIRSSRQNILVKLNALLKPVSRVLQPLAHSGKWGSATLVNAIRADLFATLSISPLTVVAIPVFAVLSLALDLPSMQQGMLPVMTVALILVLADMATRDTSSGMMNLLFTMPGIQGKYLLWKFASALLLTSCFTLLPGIRLFSLGISPVISLVIGSCFFAAGSVGLGVLTRSQKPFILFYLMLLYIALNAPKEPAFDFAGFTSRATVSVQLTYALLTLSILIAAQMRHKLAAKNM